MRDEQLNELLYQALQSQQESSRFYEMALRCAVNDELKEHWARQLSETRNHEQLLLDALEAMGLDPSARTAGRERVQATGDSLAHVMQRLLEGGPSQEAQLAACECVLRAEAGDALYRELLAPAAEGLEGEPQSALKRAARSLESDGGARHTAAWARALWLESLGLSPAPASAERRKRLAGPGAPWARAVRRERI